MVGSMGGGVSTPDAQHVCGLPNVDIMRAMPSPQHCGYVQRVGINAMWNVRLYIGRRGHATVRVRLPVWGAICVFCFDAQRHGGAIPCGTCGCMGWVHNMRLRCSSLPPMHTTMAVCANFGMVAMQSPQHPQSIMSVCGGMLE